MFPRVLAPEMERRIKSPYGVLLLGPRQTGKTTLIESVVQRTRGEVLRYRLQETRTFEEIAKYPRTILEAVEAALEQGPVTLFIDEVQKVPELIGDCQSLLDRFKGKVKIYLTGSSARKLRRQGANLLPGRVLNYFLHALAVPEIRPVIRQRILPMKCLQSPTPGRLRLEEFLALGTLPGILSARSDVRVDLLRSYASGYLQEEIRAEALTRNLGGFARFLELAALESGTAPNLSKLSQECGLPLSTVKNYFQILEDTLITRTVPAFVGSGRKRLLTTPRYYFFDTGVRNACAGLPLDARSISRREMGGLFEQFIVLEFMKRIAYLKKPWQLYFWRTTYGAEVDLILKTERELIPIEIKYSAVPRPEDIRHLRTFMSDYKCRLGFLIGLYPRALKVAPGITAISWLEI